MRKNIFDNCIQTNNILVETLLDVRQKNASNMTDEEFVDLMMYDPNLNMYVGTTNIESLKVLGESFMRWIIKMYNSGELKKYTPETIQNILATFEKAKGRRNLLPNNDINSYHSVQEIIDALSGIKDRLSANQKNKDARNNQKALKKSDKQLGMYMDGAVELLFYGDEWEVWTPHTFEGSKALRRGAVWCTGGETSNHYDSYTQNGTLYVIMNKKDNSEKYQLFVPFEDNNQKNYEYRDKNNDEQSFRALCRDNKELYDFFSTRKDVMNAYPDLNDEDLAYEEEENTSWNEETEDEVASEYNLSYGMGDRVIVRVDCSDALIRNDYLTSSMITSVIAYGYTDETPDNEDRLKEFLMDNQSFIEIFYEEEKLDALVQMFKIENPNVLDESMDDEGARILMVDALFNQSFRNYNDKIDIIKKWLAYKYNGDDSYYKGVQSAIGSFAMMDAINNYINEELWRKYDIHDNIDEFTKRDAVDGEFIPYETGHDSIREFYEDMRNRGINGYLQYLERNDLYLENSGVEMAVEDYDDFEHYKDYTASDAESIIDMFMSTAEYNEIIDGTYKSNNGYESYQNIPEELVSTIKKHMHHPQRLLQGLATGKFSPAAAIDFHNMLIANDLVQNSAVANQFNELFNLIDFNNRASNPQVLIDILSIKKDDIEQTVQYNDLATIWSENTDKANPEESEGLVKRLQIEYIYDCIPPMKKIITGARAQQNEDNEEDINEVLRIAGIKI